MQPDPTEGQFVLILCNRHKEKTMSYDPYEGRTRKAYLQDLAGEYGVPMRVVWELSGALGPNEDFDGLLTELQDYVDLHEEDEEEDDEEDEDDSAA